MEGGCCARVRSRARKNAMAVFAFCGRRAMECGRGVGVGERICCEELRLGLGLF